MNRKVPDTISGQLRWHLKRCGLNNCQLQQRADVDNGTISRFLRGERGISLTTADRLATALGLRLSRIED